MTGAGMSSPERYRRSGAKFSHVIGHPVTVCPRRSSSDIRNRRSDKRRMTKCGCPRLQQHLYGGRGHNGQQLAARLFRRDFFRNCVYGVGRFVYSSFQLGE